MHKKFPNQICGVVLFSFCYLQELIGAKVLKKKSKKEIILKAHQLNLCWFFFLLI